jgi:hypothetical protein
MAAATAPEEPRTRSQSGAPSRSWRLADALKVSPATIVRAKRVLAGHVVIQKGQDNRYYTT